jgi:hypothetical protein
MSTRATNEADHGGRIDLTHVKKPKPLKEDLYVQLFPCQITNIKRLRKCTHVCPPLRIPHQKVYALTLYELKAAVGPATYEMPAGNYKTFLEMVSMFLIAAVHQHQKLQRRIDDVSVPRTPHQNDYVQTFYKFKTIVRRPTYMILGNQIKTVTIRCDVSNPASSLIYEINRGCGRRYEPS